MAKQYPRVLKNGEGPEAIITLIEDDACTVSAQLSTMQQMAASGLTQDQARHLAVPSQQQAQCALELLGLRHS